jgi:hypothetical protein
MFKRKYQIAKRQITNKCKHQKLQILNKKDEKTQESHFKIQQ